MSQIQERDAAIAESGQSTRSLEEHISLYDLMHAVLKDGSLGADQKVTLIDELRKNNPATNDRWTYRYAVWLLGTAVILCILSMAVIGWRGQDVPDGLIAIGSAVAGIIGGLLSPQILPNKDD